jgi:hypothetical protein
MNTLNKLAYTNTKEFYKNMNSQTIDNDALEIKEDLTNDLDDEIANIEDAIYTK